MTRKAETVKAAIVLATLCCRAWGQSAPATILQVDIENWVEYVYDTPDTSKWATNPDKTPAVVPKNFTLQTGIADIVAVNGNPLENISLLQHVGFVMKDGGVFKNDLTAKK